MNRLLLLPLFFIFIQEVVAQQLPVFTQYRENHSLLNPAALPSGFITNGGEFNNALGLSYRNQWSGLKDAPQTFTARYDHRFKDFNMLVGVTLLGDKTGPTGVTGGLLRYAYQVDFSRDAYLSLGISGGVFQYRFNGSEGILRDEGDITGMSDYNNTIGEIQVGAMIVTEFYGGDIIYGGVSIPQLVGFSLGTSDGEANTIERTPHYYAVAGFYKYLNNEETFLEPSLWLKYTPNSPIQMDVNFRFQLTEVVWLGSGYSMSVGDEFASNNFHMEAGLVIGDLAGLYDRNIRIGYGYSRGINAYGPRFGNVHEINLSYNWE